MHSLISRLKGHADVLLIDNQNMIYTNNRLCKHRQHMRAQFYLHLKYIHVLKCLYILSICFFFNYTQAFQGQCCPNFPPIKFLGVHMQITYVININMLVYSNLKSLLTIYTPGIHYFLSTYSTGLLCMLMPVHSMPKLWCTLCFWWLFSTWLFALLCPVTGGAGFVR